MTDYIVTGTDTGIPGLPNDSVIAGKRPGATFTATLDSGVEAELIAAGLIAKSPLRSPVSMLADGSLAADDGRPFTPSGGSGSPANWCSFTLAAPGPLTPGAPTYIYQAADLAISSQKAADFSIGTDANTGAGAILSAAGGRFQAAFYLASPITATLDVASTAQRWLQLAVNLGPSDGADPNNPAFPFGLDALVPILVGVAQDGSVAVTAASAIGYTQPGASALSEVEAALVGGHGTDSVPINGAISIGLLWQV